MTDKEYDKKVMKLLKNPFAEPDEEMQKYLRKMEEDIDIRKELKKDAKERLKAIYGERKKGEYTIDEFIEFLHNNYPVKIATLAKALTRDFHDNFGCVRCLELKRKGISCDELIAYEAVKAEKMIKDNK